MLCFEEIFSFENLEAAHKKARRGKRSNTEVIEFELDLPGNLARLHQSLLSGRYRQHGYYHFTVYDPKVREIYALHYADRVVQHCLCDNLLAPWFDRHLIYDNAACRNNKGTHFAMNRMDAFLHAHFHRHGINGYFLKCDIRKYFDHIDHEVLRGKLFRIFHDERIRALLSAIIDSYEVASGKGLPLGNQTSQWFALWYLDELDRYVKEHQRIRYYTRYMDDFVLIHPDKGYLSETRNGMVAILERLGLTFNQKTQIFPVSHGVEYLGWRFSLTESGKVVRRLRHSSKVRMQHRLRRLKREYGQGRVYVEDIKPILNSYRAHLAHGNAHMMYKKALTCFVLVRKTTQNTRLIP